MNLQSLILILLNVFAKVTPYISNLVYALILILIGWLIAKGLQILITYVLKLIRVDVASDKVGLSAVLSKGEIKRTASELVGDLVYWVTLIVILVTILNVLGLAGSAILHAIVLYISKAISAAVILGLAMFLSVVLSGLVLLVAKNIELASAKTLAKIIQYAVVISGFVTALAQLGITSELIVTSFSVVIGAVGLAVAIAFGLGCKDIAAEFIENIFRK